MVKSLKSFIGCTFAVSIVISLLVGVVQGEEVVFYEENFNDNQAQDWELDTGWTVTEGMLSGNGLNWAEYNGGDVWSDYRVNFRLLLEEGSNMHLNYRLSEKGRYYINFPNEGGLALSKEAPWGTFHGFLTKSSISYGYNEWHNIEIIGEGPRIQVVVDGKLELDYTDPEPLLSGTIAFETLESAVAQVDDIIVFGPSPTQKGPILSTNYGYVVLYEENFNENQAQDWELQQGWTVTEGMLSGSGHEWARFSAGELSDYRVNFRLRLLEEGSGINLNYRVSGKGRYFIEFHKGGLYLKKQDQLGNYESLDESSISKEYNKWYNVEIIGEGAHIQVVVDGKLELDYIDPEPLLSGSFAFENYEDAMVQVDDIIITGPSPTSNGPDTEIIATEPEPLPEKEDDWPVYIFFIIAIGFIIFVLIRKRKTPLQEYKAKMEKWEKEGYDVTDLKREIELKK